MVREIGCRATRTPNPLSHGMRQSFVLMKAKIEANDAGNCSEAQQPSLKREKEEGREREKEEKKER